METLEQIKADAVEVFCYDREVRPQDRAHAYLGKYRVKRGYNDTAMQVAVVDMIERAYVLDAIAENPHRFIERYELYCEEVIRLGGKL